MKITYLGTGAAEGFPAMFCGCKYCRESRLLHPDFVRTRSQVAVDDNLLVDFPPESYVHSLGGKLDLTAVRYLLVTHSHMDHFYAHDFILRGYKYAQLSEDILEIYGNSEVGEVFKECTAREMKTEVARHVRFNLVKGMSCRSVGDYFVCAVPAMHGTREEALLYYISRNGKGYLHLHDTGDLSDESVAYLAQCGAKADIVTYDCTFLEEPTISGARHMGIPKILEVKEKLCRAGIVGDESISVISHFSHNCNPTAERIEKVAAKYSFTAAYDGLTLEV